MTKEDLKTEAESCWSRWSKDEPISIQDIHLMVVASYIEAAESRENRIAELEATLTEQKQYTAFKCAQAKEKIEALEKEKCELLGIIQGKDKEIFVLKKENAELKERFERAKEIIKDFVDRDDSCWLIQKKAEEFLKECE